MPNPVRANVLVVLLMITLSACTTSGESTVSQLASANLNLGCDRAFPLQVTDPGFPPELVVCGDLRSLDAHFRIVNGTESVWTIHSAIANVRMAGAEPGGAPSARVRAFRELRGISQSEPVANPYRWVIEPGTSAVVTPGLIDAILEVEPRMQGAWSNFSAFEKLAQKAGSSAAKLIEDPRYRKAGASCVGFGFSLFDVSPNAPKNVQTLIAQLRTGAQGFQCINDLDAADRLRSIEVREGRSNLRPINSELFRNQLSESASVLDRWLEYAGKVVKQMPKHVP